MVDFSASTHSYFQYSQTSYSFLNANSTATSLKLWKTVFFSCPTPITHLLSMGQKPTIISLMIHKPSTYTKLHHPTGLHKEISESPHSLIPLFHTRNEKDKILDSPSILISFNNTSNTKSYSPTR